MLVDAEPHAAAVYLTHQNRIETPQFGAVRKFIGSDKAYIQHYNPEGRNWKCIVHITGNCCKGNYAALCNQLMQYCLSPSISIQDVRNRKAELAEMASRSEDVN